MNPAYIDTSVLASIIFNEPGAKRLAGQLHTHKYLLASNLLEAELQAACAREGVDLGHGALSRIKWVLPDRALTREIEKVDRAGYLRGADLWHVATALYASPQPDGLVFMTLDNQQAAVATTLGFSVLQGP